MKRKNNKAAIELSIGTIVIIVIAMSMLILGLVLVRNIFQTSTDLVNDLGSKTKTTITETLLDPNNQKDVTVLAGSDRRIKVKSGYDEGGGVGVGARTADGSPANGLKYKVSLQDPQRSDCIIAI